MSTTQKKPQAAAVELDFGQPAIPLDPKFFGALCLQFGINYLRLTGSLRLGGCNQPTSASDLDFCYRRFPKLPHRLTRVERAQFSETVRENCGRSADLSSVVDLLGPNENPYATWNYIVDYRYDRSVGSIWNIKQVYLGLDASLKEIENNRQYFTSVLFELQRETRLLRVASMIGLNCRVPLKKWPSTKYPDVPWIEFVAEVVTSTRQSLIGQGLKNPTPAAVDVAWERQREKRAARVLSFRQRFEEIARTELPLTDPIIPEALKRRLLSGQPMLS